MKIMKAIFSTLLLTGVCLAACPPTSETCPYDNMPMYATGQMKDDGGGVREYEFAHEVTIPDNTPQPYDPNKPYKAPRTVRHTKWVECR